jgi:hypothetical protein
LSPASAVSPILTKFHSISPTPPATQYQCPFGLKIKGPSTGESERRHCEMREDGEKIFFKARRTEGIFALDMSLQFKKMKFEILVIILPVPEY